MSEPPLHILRELHNQFALSPADVRRLYANRLEDFLLEIDREQQYPYEFVYYRVTGFRPAEARPEVHAGSELVPELQVLLSVVSGPASREVATVEEDVFSVPQAAARAGVSVRTIHRWRKRGLVCRRYTFPDGHRRMGIRASALRRFAEQNPEMTALARRFARLSPSEKARAVREARRLVRDGETAPSAVAARIAPAMGRSVEAVRQVLRRHEEDHPDDALFPPVAAPHKAPTRREIYTAYCRGTPVSELCARYGRSRQSIYRIVNSQRAEELLAEDIPFFYEEGFAEAGGELRIFTAELQELVGQPAKRAAAPQGGQWWESPLDEPQENALFRAYNFAKYLAALARRDMWPRRYVPSALIDRAGAMDERARQLRDFLLRVHLPLLEHVAWQHADNSALAGDLVAKGRKWLAELADRFDYRGPGRFPSYATLELLKRFARDTSSEKRRP